MITPVQVDKDKVRLLVAALRSGEYGQAKTALTVISEDGDRHCCLGVATLVAIKHGVPIEAKRVDPLGRPRNTVNYCDLEGCEEGYPDSRDNSDTRLTALAAKFYGAPERGFGVLTHPDGTHGSPVELNDSQSRSFAYIADAFEYTFLREDEANGAE